MEEQSQAEFAPVEEVSPLQQSYADTIYGFVEAWNVVGNGVSLAALEHFKRLAAKAHLYGLTVKVWDDTAGSFAAVMLGDKIVREVAGVQQRENYLTAWAKDPVQ